MPFPMWKVVHMERYADRQILCIFENEVGKHEIRMYKNDEWIKVAFPKSLSLSEDDFNGNEDG